MTRFLARMAVTVVIVALVQWLSPWVGEPEPGIIGTALLMAGGALVAMMYAPAVVVTKEEAGE